MHVVNVDGLIAFLGSLAQLAGSFLLVALFFLLRGHAGRRGYFLSWGNAWLAVVVAFAALALRSLAMPGFDRTQLDEGQFEIQTLYFVYLLGKLLYIAALLIGTLMYARGVRAQRATPWAFVLVTAYCALALTLETTLFELVIWQAPLNVLVLGYCAWLLLELPVSRRTFGSRVTGGVFAAISALWVSYLAAWGYATVAGAGALRESPLGLVVRYNTYADLVLQILLGYGMVVILMEDAKREVDDAHAELAVAHDQLRRSALYDELTGCLNRRAYVEGVGLESARATFGTVVVVDADDLKAVNDSYGHAAGDELLRLLVDVLHVRIRPSDHLYRWGGDEFLIVFPGAQVDEVRQRLGELLAAAPPITVGGSAVRLSVSVGAAAYAGAEGMQQAIELADAEMYQQKKQRKVAARPPRTDPELEAVTA